MDSGIFQVAAEYYAVPGCFTSDASTQFSGTHQQSPAFVITEFTACPMFIEESFPLEITVELFAYLRTDIFQCKADETFYFSFQLLGYA